MGAYAIKYLFVILHIVTAAAWFGLGLRLAAQARLVLNLDRSAATAVATDIGRSVRLMGVFSVLTLVFALVAFFIGGGFAAYGPVYHTSILLILILIGVQYGLIGRAWSTLEAGLSSPTAGDAEQHRKRIAMGTGIGHLIWLVLLVLMFANRLG